MRWLKWLLEETEDGDDGVGVGEEGDGARQKWREALEKVRVGVQEAAAERGMGRVEFG